MGLSAVMHGCLSPVLLSSLLGCGLRIILKLLFPGWLSSPELAALVLLSALGGRGLLRTPGYGNTVCAESFQPQVHVMVGVHPVTGLLLVGWVLS